MKIRLTPLNIVSAICLVLAVWVSVWSILIALGAFVSDLIFRRLVPDLRKLWVVEGMVVIFIIIILYILKAGIK